jgi:hypothetical protein
MLHVNIRSEIKAQKYIHLRNLYAAARKEIMGITHNIEEWTFWSL